MLISQNFQIALRALAANKMRSVLTMLGIIIGVGAVVALLALGNGATASITGQLEGIGANMVTIMPGRTQLGPGLQRSAQNNYLFFSDYEALESQMVHTAGLSPVYRSNKTLKYGSQSLEVGVVGTNEDYLAVRAYEIAKGRSITASDRRTGARVVVLGTQTAQDLFGSLNPVGKAIKIDGVRFEVVGVLKAKGSSGMENSDDVALIPIETGYTKLFGSAATQDGQQIVSTIMLSASSSDQVNSAMAQAERILRREHKLDSAEQSDFSVLSQNDFLSTVNTISTTLTIFLGAIAGISLLVGGIGIMNIMLVSVTERTREIGLRKAVGARKNQILLQFLVETVTLSVLGGLIGIGLGVGIALVMTALDLIAAQITMNSILLAFGFAVAVGLFFGIYPAYRAASLHPIEALRYE